MNGKNDSQQLVCVAAARRPRSADLPPASAGSCCGAAPCHAVGTQEAQQTGPHVDTDIIWAQSAHRTPGACVPVIRAEAAKPLIHPPLQCFLPLLLLARSQSRFCPARCC